MAFSGANVSCSVNEAQKKDFLQELQSSRLSFDLAGADADVFPDETCWYRPRCNCANRRQGGVIRRRC